MRGVLVAALVALVVSLLGTPSVIRFFRRQGYGQEIREDGPSSHLTKRGTPTMGGTVIILATLVGYFVAHLVAGIGLTASGLLVLMVMTGLGVVGFLDDYIKIRKQRSLGLTARTKFAGQAAVALAFGLLAVRFKNDAGLLPGSTFISVVRDTGFSVGLIGFPLLAWIIIAATSNAVNLTDGLDGLAAGTSAMVFGAYVVISFWQFGNICEAGALTQGCYYVRDPLDVALVAAAAMGACFGFLWWNASPAKIFMGDTGSLALGGAFASIAIVSRTELLLFVLGGLFVIETLSVMIQVAFFKATKKRVFNMAPIHHHFELAEWPETTVIIRFWIVSGLAVAFGLGLFYAEFLSHGGG
ncbi:phospho-N-acetylmuramoyl-pentapeptide-transferase [Parafrankia irregularis]|uniref:Phospho-N-acetylmuramoyl-pentapeptide-transferase n=1 Tax=Parafrankia irregularis TaxID=795642 RepID=A0A0S4QW65_9ACTN|nr:MULTISPECIES: phospho-N-acetylmuramoyl-pentapeptide-transferase [Frankiaceae]EFC83826.1 phospho-N-acetylmuramoyl-pentapeptide-transferase [Parafrankia sp. EUN1f]KPM55590.1 phospho-N-acetylmuramoyl-pentapeptide-transferase [Frankia sp. R43]MBE3201962.1 phospho-N-acetylmuramoyl-pentapeptide-transferase [Parafrankia sp. CH37]CUU59449.1 phospho-N-acetylmuramoyl-pentapeptide-transferase [Parafrankia irregularis]